MNVSLTRDVSEVAHVRIPAGTTFLIKEQKVFGCSFRIVSLLSCYAGDNLMEFLV